LTWNLTCRKTSGLTRLGQRQTRQRYTLSETISASSALDPRERAPERPRFQHAEQQVDVGADEAVPIVLDRPDVGGRAELDPRGLAGHVVVPADQAAQPLGQRIDDAFAGDIGRYHDQGAVPAVLVKAVRPRDSGAVERPLQHVVELLVQVQADFIIPARPGEASDVHREHGAQLTVSRRGGHLPGRPAHRSFAAGFPVLE
jgi:hypothetical protein